MGKRSGGATAAIAALIDAHLPHIIHTFAAGSDNYGSDAAAHLHERLGIEKERVFKTLIVDLTAGKGPRRRLAVCCIPVTAQLSLKKAARAHGVAKVTMADPQDAQRSSGYVVGGISPIGQKTPLPTAVDSSASDHTTVFVSGGKRGLDIELTAADLQAITGAQLVDLRAD